MNSPKYLQLAILSCCLSIFSALPLKAEEDPDPLFRVKKVTVYVAYENTGKAPRGMSENRLQTLIELKLRTAGLKVLTPEEFRKDATLIPFLRAAVYTLETQNQNEITTGFAYRFDLQALTYNLSPINQAVVPAELWSNGTLAVGDKEGAAAQIERIVGELTDSFLNAWLKANPKE